MVADLRRWSGFGPSLRVARNEAGLLLRDMGIHSASTLSRIENGTVPPSRAVVERYADLAGRPDLITEYLARELSVTEDDGDEADPDTFGPLVRLTDLEVIVDIGRVITVMERRTIVAVKPLVRTFRLISVMSELEGSVPRVLDARAYNATVTEHRWLDERTHVTYVALPAPIRAGGPPVWFHLVREYDRLAPRLTQSFGYPIAELRLNVTFPSPGYHALHVEGLPSHMVDSAIRAAIEGRPHPLVVHPLREARQTTVVFKELQPSLSYGLGWIAPS